MFRNKKAISLLLALAMLISAALPAFAAPVNYGDELANQPNKTYTQKFTDVPKSHWAFSYIGEMADRGVLSGYPDGRFYPENNVTRGEFAKIMTLAAGLPLNTNASSNYADVNTDDWYCPYIETARYYLSGYTSNGTSYYMPESNALREDIAVALVKLKGYDTAGFDLSILQTMFTDWQSISEGARKYVAVAVEQGLISGYEDRTFRGQAGVTRAETSTLLWRAYQYGNGNKDFEQGNLEKEELPSPTPTPAPTVKPTEKPEKPVETEKPSKEPEEKPEPTQTPEPEVKKTHYVDTLTDANVKSTNFYATSAGDTLYYYDNKDNVIYEMDMITGDKSEFLNVSEMQYEKTETEDDKTTGMYSDYSVSQLYYNDASNELLLVGGYTKFQSSKSNEKKNDSLYVTYNIIDGGISDVKEILSRNENKRILGNMANGDLVEATHINDMEVYSLGQGSHSNDIVKVSIADKSTISRFRPFIFESNGEIYGILPGRSDKFYAWDLNLTKYDFTTSTWIDLWDDDVLFTFVGLKDNMIYTWYENTICKIGTDGRPHEETISDEAINVLDYASFKKSFKDYCARMFINSNGDFIFYDSDTHSWRIFGEI